MRLRILTLLGVVGLAVAVAGCGGSAGGKSSSGGATPGSTSTSSSSTSASAVPDGASVVPATIPAFVSLSSDFSSAQWKQALTLARAFPGFDAAYAKALAQLKQQGLDLNTDIQPALGPELDLAFLDTTSQNDFVIATKPADKAKLDAVLAKVKGQKPARADSGGYVLLAKQQKVLGSLASGSRLSGDASFKAAMSALPASDIVRLYLGGTAVQKALQGALAKNTTTSALPIPKTTTARLDWISAALSAQADGIRLDGAVKVTPQTALSTYTAELPQVFPAGALAYISVAHLDGALDQLLKSLGKSQASLNKTLAQVQGIGGFSIEKDLIPLFKNEAGIGVYPATPGATPTIVFALKVDDEKKAVKILDGIGALAPLIGGGNSLAPATVPGISNAKELKLGKTSLFYGTLAGKLAISNRATGLTMLEGSGAKLADDALYKGAKAGGAMPDATSGFVYLSKTALPFLFGLAQQSGSKVSSSVKASTKPLQSLLLYATPAGDHVRVAGFAGVQQ